MTSAFPPASWPLRSPGAIYCSTLDQVADTLAQIAQPEDLILTVGAGDIFRAGEKLLAKEK